MGGAFHPAAKTGHVESWTSAGKRFFVAQRGAFPSKVQVDPRCFDETHPCLEHEAGIDPARADASGAGIGLRLGVVLESGGTEIIDDIGVQHALSIVSAVTDRHHSARIDGEIESARVAWEGEDAGFEISAAGHEVGGRRQDGSAFLLHLDELVVDGIDLEAFFFAESHFGLMRDEFVGSIMGILGQLDRDQRVMVAQIPGEANQIRKFKEVFLAHDGVHDEDVSGLRQKLGEEDHVSDDLFPGIGIHADPTKTLSGKGIERDGDRFQSGVGDLADALFRDVHRVRQHADVEFPGPKEMNDFGEIPTGEGFAAANGDLDDAQLAHDVGDSSDLGQTHLFVFVAEAPNPAHPAGDVAAVGNAEVGIDGLIAQSRRSENSPVFSDRFDCLHREPPRSREDRSAVRSEPRPSFRR